MSAARREGTYVATIPLETRTPIMTAYAATPSVAATVSGLRTRGHGATYQPTSAVKVGGFSGIYNFS